MWMKAAVLTGCAVLVGCAGTRAPGDVADDTEHVVIKVPQHGEYRLELQKDGRATAVFLPMTADEVFQRLLHALPRVGLKSDQLTDYDAGAHRVTFRNARVRSLAERRLSEFLRCGYSLTSPRADQGQVSVTLDAWVEPDGTASTLFIQFRGTARDRGQSSSLTRCATRGTFEELLVTELLAGDTAPG